MQRVAGLMTSTGQKTFHFEGSIMKVLMSMALAITACSFSGCAAVAVHEARVCQAVQQMMLADQEQKKMLPTPHSYPAPIRVVLKND